MHLASTCLERHAAGVSDAHDVVRHVHRRRCVGVQQERGYSICSASRTATVGGTCSNNRPAAHHARVTSLEGINNQDLPAFFALANDLKLVLASFSR